MKRILTAVMAISMMTWCQMGFGQLSAAAGLLTVGQIRAALNDAVVGVQSATVTAGAEAKGLANSLQANIQNVIADIDARFSKQMDKRIDDLGKAERQFMSDARELVYRGREASVALTKVLSDETRRTIGDADIAAYNASYSLPCRTQVPRIVYWRPTSAVARGEEIVVFIHGNFLNYGKGAKVTVSGKPAQFTLNSGVIAVKLPPEMIQKVEDMSSVSIGIEGLDTRVIEPRTASWLFGCKERLEPTNPSSLTVVLAPRYHYRIAGEVWATYKEWSSPFVHHGGNLSRSSDNCDHNEDVSLTVCVPPSEMRAIRGDYSIKSKSGPSSFGPSRASGDACILFPGRLAGGGYDWILGVRNCRSSAWLNVDWSVTAQRLETKETNHNKFDDNLPIAQYSHAKNYAQAPHGDDWRWRYIVRVDQMRGSQVIQTETLSDARLDNGDGWTTSMKDGVLNVVLPGER